MKSRGMLIAAALVLALSGLSCKYIVVPTDLDLGETSAKGTWSAFATGLSLSGAGDLHIDLTIRNDTGDWSAMDAAASKPAILSMEGRNISCEKVFVSTGGHRLAPGFQMRGYTAGTMSAPQTQMIYVECAGAPAAEGGKLTIDYSYVTGEYNYYEQDKSRVNGKLQVDLDQVVVDAAYPVGEATANTAQKQDAEIVALNKVALRLTSVERSDGGLRLTWHTANPGEYPTYVHIGNPPVIGADGVLYGFYETPDIVSVPLTPAGGEMEWTTEVAVPREDTGLYIMLSVETGKARLFANYAINITDK